MFLCLDLDPIPFELTTTSGLFLFVFVSFDVTVSKFIIFTSFDYLNDSLESLAIILIGEWILKLDSGDIIWTGDSGDTEGIDDKRF